jgi:hypothetical protein
MESPRSGRVFREKGWPRPIDSVVENLGVVGTLTWTFELAKYSGITVFLKLSIRLSLSLHLS